MICSLYSTNLKRLQQVIDISIKYKRQIAILGIKAQRTINVAMENGWLTIPEVKEKDAEKWVER